MELNAKISSLEDEVKLLKGEVKLILSEIRTAVLGQTNPFAVSQALPIDSESPGTRPAIRVVKVPTEGEGEEAETPAEPVSSWNEEDEPLGESLAEAEAPEYPEYEQTPPPQPVEEKRMKSGRTPAPARGEPSPLPRREVPAMEKAPSWSLLKVAGLAVWAEEALKEVGPERLQTLLDLCEFAGYLPNSAKEALMRVMNLGIAIDERTETPSVNECLVILYQLHALMQGEEPEVVRGRTSAGK